MTRRSGRRGNLIETYLGREISPLIAAIARNHVPEAAREDFLDFVWTGCSIDQLKMIIRYMGGSEPPVTEIEIEEMNGELYATGQLSEGLKFMGNHVTLTHTIPETLRSALVGKPLSALIDHPLLPGDEKIVAIRKIGVGKTLAIEIGGYAQN